MLGYDMKQLFLNGLKTNTIARWVSPRVIAGIEAPITNVLPNGGALLVAKAV
jgi:hypothetical protein